MAMALVSKLYCSSSPTVLVVRKRPHAVGGGGFVVTDCTQRVVFKAEGCGTLGTNRELLLRDGDGNVLLLIRRKGGMVEAVSLHKKWKGFKNEDMEGSESKQLVFILKEPKSCFAAKDKAMRITTAPRTSSGGVNKWDFETKGSFPDRQCSIVDVKGNPVALIGNCNKATAAVTAAEDVYQVGVKGGVDQAFVCGVIAILDNIYGESTTC